jgi:hypothetical protein
LVLAAAFISDVPLSAVVQLQVLADAHVDAPQIAVEALERGDGTNGVLDGRLDGVSGVSQTSTGGNASLSQVVEDISLGSQVARILEKVLFSVQRGNGSGASTVLVPLMAPETVVITLLNIGPPLEHLVEDGGVVGEVLLVKLRSEIAVGRV